ncbi:MAG: hypothetical protein QM487_11030 [Candidatus Marithrix sp.]
MGIADLLKDKTQHNDSLAIIATNTDNDSLCRLLRALARMGIFVETKPKYFKNNSLSACLQDNESGSVRNFILLRAS